MLGFQPLDALPISTEPPPQWVWFYSYLTVASEQNVNGIHVVSFISSATINTEAPVLLVIKPVDFISYLTIENPSWTFILTRIVEMISYMNIGSLQSAVIGETSPSAPSDPPVFRPDLDTEGRVWVVNTDTGASSQYEQYGFNSFFKRDGISYGIANDGIYKLDGDDDAGVDISALVNFGKSNFGITHKKKAPYIYVGIGSDGLMYLKCNVDGSEYVYTMRSSSTAVKNHRFDTGKGLEGTYWNLELMNKEGADFVIASVQFQPLISSRRI
jgi:hypothetical protein